MYASPNSRLAAPSLAYGTPPAQQPQLDAPPRPCQPDHSPLQDAWIQWARQAPAHCCQHRTIAVERMLACLETEDPILNLSGLGLTDLPPLLPPGVESLNLSFNHFSEVPPLPDGLRILMLSDNALQELPPDLPDSLQRMDVSFNQLGTLPNKLPQQLLVLKARHNRISGSLFFLPRTLVELDLAHNRLRGAPMRLPAALRELNVCANQLAFLPEGLPSGLRRLHASNNQIATLPPELPPRLEELNLRQNSFAILPHAVLHLPHWCVVRLEANMIASDVLPGGLGRDHPLIYVSQASADRHGEPRPLSQAIAMWLAQPAARWSDIAREPHAMAFSHFIDRLAGLRSTRQGGPLRDIVKQWLGQLAEVPALRAQTFELAHNASETCDDGVALLYSQMQQAWRAHQVQAGALDHDLPAVVRLGRQLFRLERLEQIARAKAQAIGAADEVEVLLGYQVKLRHALQLEGGIDRMLYFTLSRLEKSDLESAAEQVQHAENKDFRHWLLRWPAWKSVLQRMAPNKCGLAAEALARQVGGGHYQRQVKQLLAAQQLQGIPDAEVQVGRLVMDRLQQESDEALAIDVLGCAQCDALLGDQWQMH